MSWFRQEAAYFQNPNVILAGWHGSIVFLVVCHMARLHGWDGSAPKRHLTPELIRRFCGAPETCHSDIDIANGIQSCIDAELLIDRGDRLEIRNWRKYQPDPTALKRKRAERARKKASRDVTGRHRDVTLQTDRQTEQTDGTDEQTDRARGAPLSVSASLPESARNGRRKVQPLSPVAWLSVDAILDQLCRGAGPTKADQERGLALRKLRRAGLMTDEQGGALLDEFKGRFKASIGAAKRQAQP